MHARGCCCFAHLQGKPECQNPRSVQWKATKEMHRFLAVLALLSGYHITTALFVQTPCHISVQSGGRLGNQLTAAMFGQHLAQIYGTAEHIINDLPDFYSGIFANVTTTVIGQEASNCSGYLHADPWHHFSLPRPVQLQYRHAGGRLQSHMISPIEPWLQTLLDMPDTLTIYMRAGDIFDVSGYIHPWYIQAPCAYYMTIIRTVNPKHVVLVTASIGKDGGPCAAQLNAEFPDIHVTVILDTVSISYSVLLHSHSLVLSGYSTFGVSAVMLANSLRTVFVPTFSWQDSYTSGIVTDDLPGVEVVRYLVHNFPEGGQWTAAAAGKLTGKYKISRISAATVNLFGELEPTYSYSTVLVVTKTSKASYLTQLHSWFSLVEVQGFVETRHPSQHHPVGVIVLADCHGMVDVKRLQKEFTLFQSYHMAVVRVDADAFPCAARTAEAEPKASDISHLNAFNTTHLVVLEDVEIGHRASHFKSIRYQLTHTRKAKTFKLLHDNHVVLVATPLGRHCCDFNATLQHTSLMQFPDNSLIKGSGKSCFVVINGTRYDFPNLQSFTSRGFDFSQVKTVPDEVLEDIPFGGSVK